MEDQQRAIDAAALEAERRKTIAQVYLKHQQMIRCEANDRQIIAVIERFAGVEVVPTFDLFETALAENPSEMQNFAQQSIERTREQIVAEILTLLTSKNEGRDGKFDSFNLRSEEKRMASWTLDALRVRLAEIKTKQRMSTAPVSELKTFIQDAHADKRKYVGYPDLPKSIWQDGKTVTVNATFFKSLDLFSLRRYTRIYSVEQCNERIAQG